jgi:hypothetical protein
MTRKTSSYTTTHSRTILFALAAILFGCFTAISASAASTFYVRSDGASSPTCNGSANAAAAATPNCAFQTLNQANTAASAGDMIILGTPLTISADVTIDRGKTLNLGTVGTISVNSGKTITINGAMVDPDDRLVFSGSGAIVFGDGSIPRYNLAWWTVASDSTSDTAGFAAAIACIVASGHGGTLFVPSGTWEITAGVTVPPGVTIEGTGHKTDSGVVTNIKLITNNNIAAFTVGENTRNVAFKDLRIDGGTTTGGIGILATGAYPNSSFGLLVREVAFTGLDLGVDIHSTSSDWELQQILIDHSSFLSCATAGIRNNTVNNSLTISNCDFFVPANSDAIVLDATGPTLIENNLFNGHSSECERGQPASSRSHAAVAMHGQHGSVTLMSNEDEGFTYSFLNDASMYDWTVSFIGNTFQAWIQLDASVLINSSGNTYMSGAYRDSGSAAARVLSQLDNPRDVDICNASAPRDMNGFSAGSSFVETSDPYHNTVFGLPTSFVANPLFNGFLSNPWVTIQSDEAGKVLMRLGTSANYYELKRDGANGYLDFTGNQGSPYQGYSFDAPLITTKAASSGVATLTDGTSIATDASKGNLFRVTLGGNRTLSNPTAAVDGQLATWEIIQDGTGGRTLAYGGDFAFGTDVPNCTVTSTANKRDFLSAIYNAAAGKWFVTRCVRGY